MSSLMLFKRKALVKDVQKHDLAEEQGNQDLLCALLLCTWQPVSDAAQKQEAVSWKLCKVR